jgi:hypothetical protein
MLFLDEPTAIKFLEDNDYYVYKMYNIKKLPKNSVDLAKYFFSLARVVYGIDYMSIKWKAEFSYSKTFIRQMSQNGNHKDKLAISQCKYVIDTVFNNLDVFEKYYKVNSLKIFAAEKSYWIVEKCFELDKEGIKGRTGYTEDEYNALYDEYEKATHIEPDKEKIKQELLKILGD